LLASQVSPGAGSDKMHKVLPILLAVVAVAGLPAESAAQMQDRQLAQRVVEAIRTYPQYGVFDGVEVDVQDGAVTLSGRVTNPKKKDDIERRVRRIDGLASLTNDIGVLPLSQADDALRNRVARAIYNHPMFWVHGQRPLPPIHVVVERGRITLMGVADTTAERALAASLAQVPGSFGVTNRIKTPRE
jgi:hyperosmotically inducible periplasmic protein